ncbi:MAG: phenylalanine--tRNA ligase subunit beta [candidate division Zixibacteria bacterium]
MKLPYSWLKEITGVDWSAEEMEDRLTCSGTAGALEKYDPEHFKNVVTAKITSLEKHPNADKLQVAEVTTGETTYTVICGAPNCAIDQIVPLALPGAKLRGEFEVKEITMRGVKSSGIICAEDELGLSNDHTGIMVFDDDTELNKPVFEHLDLNDPVIDFEITPNRPDCLSANGVAREIAALADLDINLEKEPPPEISERAENYIGVIIDDADACPRYVARIIKNIKIGPSPDWLKKRLTDCDIRPINNIVDITNYVMLETGQPLHAFDYDRFGSKEVAVRRAHDKEKFTTLDGQEHELDSDILLITNGKESVAAAGVMGGIDSEVTPETTTVLLESAYFNPSVIRRSRKKLSIISESSYRFERGIDPNGTVRAADRAAALMAELAGGEVLQGVVDNYAKRIDPIKVEMRPSRANKLIGANIPIDFMKNKLTRLGMKVESNDDNIIAEVPAFRPDITREVDLIEEIARIYGLDNIPSNNQNSGPLFSPTHRRDTIRNDLREIMTGLGFEESLGTGFAQPKRMKLLEPSIEPIEITNPISDEFGYLRSRLLYSLLVSTGNNIRHRNINIKLFEIGKIYIRTKDLPIEPEYFGFILSGQTDDIYWQKSPGESDLYELKGIANAICDRLRISSIALEPEAYGGYDKSCSFSVVRNDQKLGNIGRVAPKIAQVFDIKQDCFAAEFEISKLIDLDQGITPFKSLPRYPASARDIAIVVRNSIFVRDIHDSILNSGGKLVESVEFFDMFTGKPVPENMKSLAFSVSFRSSDKTLEDAEVDAVFNKIVKNLEQKFDARLRE